jgi:hypothetical protein
VRAVRFLQTRDLPDSIKALVGRLQIPVLKAAMLDGAFSQEITSVATAGQRAGGGRHRSRRRWVRRPLYRKIEQIVRRILDDFTDDIGLFVSRERLEAFSPTRREPLRLHPVDRRRNQPARPA